MTHDQWMQHALTLAQEAMAAGEVPVGCVIVDSGGNLIGQGRNRREETGQATAHAEILAIEAACSALGDWRLGDCSLYVTLEPCPMCAGAILNGRVGKVFYGVKDPTMGACGSVLNLFMEDFWHSPQLVGGILEESCARLMVDFFQKLR
ncbi:MAG: nucleoside deaminase [Oscillospiraceae bacterium]|nr:nucleoside deaminase [Oscillospiraceae bacterium]